MSERGRHSDMAAAVIARTFAVVDYIRQLKLTPGMWDRAAENIETAIAAAAARDLEGLRRATEQLTLIGPLRVTKPDGSLTTSPSPELIERTNTLIHFLQAMQPAGGEDAAPEGDGR